MERKICKHCPSMVCRAWYRTGRIEGYCLEIKQNVIGDDKCRAVKQYEIGFAEQTEEENKI